MTRWIASSAASSFQSAVTGCWTGQGKPSRFSPGPKTRIPASRFDHRRHPLHNDFSGFKAAQVVILMTRLACIAAILALLAPVAASAQVYRCSHENVTVFSDQPCGLNSEQVSDSEKISFVEPDDNLPEQAAANRLFVQERQRRLAEQRRRAKQRQESTEATQQAVVENHYEIGRASCRERVEVRGRGGDVKATEDVTA